MNAKNLKAIIYLKQLGFPMENIRKAMPKLIGVKQCVIARRIGISDQCLMKNLTGNTQSPEIQADIARYLDVPTRELFE